ncbi:MAG: polysaccharide deacetylase family protein [Aminipila sp.]
MRFRKLFAVIFSLVMVISYSNVCYAGELDNSSRNEHLYIPILMYHHFVKDPQSRELAGAAITEAKFEEDMTYLAENGYTALLPQDLKAIKEGKMKIPEKPIMITFDDGYESAYTIAYPILKKTDMKATVFVIVGSVENPKKNEIKKLNWKQMKEMYESGIFDIQSHSYNLHNQDLKGQYMRFLVNGIQKGLIECRAQYELRVEADITKSIDTIEENVGNKVLCFSYPYGVYEEWGKDILQKNGVLFGFGTTYGSGDLKGNLYYLNRFSVGMETDLSGLLEQ